MRKKLIVLSLMLMFVLGCTNVIYARDNTSTVKVYTDGKLITENINLDEFKNVSPGDSRVQKVAIKNESEDEYDFYIIEETVKSLEETNKAAGGAYKFDMRVGTTLDESVSLLSKEAGGYSADGAASADGLSEIDELDGYTYFTGLKKKQSTYLFLCLEVLGQGNDNYTTSSSTVDGSNGLGYTNALGQLKLTFKVNSSSHQGESNKKVVTKTIEKVKKVIIKKYVKTGDSMKLFVFGAVLLIGIAMIVIAFFKNKKSKKTIGLIVALTCMLAVLPISTVKAASTVTVTFRAGQSGEFDTSLAESISNSNVKVAKDYIKITVAKPDSGVLTAGQIFESGFGTADIDSVFARITHHDNVALLSAADWKYDSSNQIKHNKEYVLKYGVLVDPVMYTVRFMDVSSYDAATDRYTQEIAAPIINYGNAGDKITVKSALIDNYATTEKEYTINLSKNGDNTHSFYYAYTGVDDTNQTEVTYETRYRYLTDEQVVVINDANNNAENPNNTGNPNNAANMPNGNDANAQDNQNNQDTPDAGDNLAGAEDNQERNIIDNNVPKVADGTDDGIKNIEDDKVPSKDKADSFDKLNAILISCIGVVLVSIIGVTVLIIYRKKRQS